VRRGSGAIGNGRLTSLVGLVLLVLLAVEGSTIPWIRPLLSVHVFVGMLLLGPVALKLASTGYRFVRYYTGGPEYVRAGPPAPLMRLLVAPVLVLSTLTLFGTGVALLVTPHQGAVVGLHKASFVVWFGAMALHVLAYTLPALKRVRLDLVGRRAQGRGLRMGAAGLATAAGVGIAVASYPSAKPWFHRQFAELRPRHLPTQDLELVPRDEAFRCVDWLGSPGPSACVGLVPCAASIPDTPARRVSRPTSRLRLLERSSAGRRPSRARTVGSTRRLLLLRNERRVTASVRLLVAPEGPAVPRSLEDVHRPPVRTDSSRTWSS
jgi:hypothetical protein